MQRTRARPPSLPADLNILLSLVFFASGASALIFETLWFRQAGLLLGNSLWATSLVTSSFMGGLAGGNALAAARGNRSHRPLLVYASLEATIGITGLLLIIVLPNLSGLLAPMFALLLDQPAALNLVRFMVAFALLLVPATAMGATLPILAGALSATEPRFGRVLGMLYGWNTLGAVAGALAGEVVLIERLGVRGTAGCAVILNAGAVVVALLLSPRFQGREVAVEVPPRGNQTRPREGRLLAAAFLAGGLLLALEVVWFRLLLLFVYGTSLSFAVMLAVVLLGIGAGGLLVGLLARSDREAGPWLPTLALFAGGLTAWTYAALPDSLARSTPLSSLLDLGGILVLSIPLMLPTSLLSGALFTLMGMAVRAQGRGATSAAGAVAFANTAGAMVGPLIATFVMLPGLGIERTILTLAAGYGLVALLAAGKAGPLGEASRRAVALRWLAAVTFGAFIALFPFGLMKNHLSLRPARPYLDQGQRIEAYREGLTETITYLARDLWGETTSHRLLTNSHSMSGSHFASARYMRFFVYLPVALHPTPRKALLISYGVGLTAKALTETRELESIDVVDISKDILELGRIVFPRAGTFPLDDPRVRVHVEDGRFFLLTTTESFDLITAEPPPPKGSGISNLYSREYFHLVRNRLAQGGMATYWLPVYQLTAGESKAVIAAFCDAFEDCSLWTGTGLEWMLLGSSGGGVPVSEEAFGEQWRDPTVGPELREMGFERPELFGTTFLADAPRLRRLTSGAEPLEDDHPLRLSPRFVTKVDPLYFSLMDVTETRRAFASSEWVQRVWPGALRQRTLEEFDTQRLINLDRVGYGGPPISLGEVEALLTGTSLRVPILSAFLTSDAEISAARKAASRGVNDPFLDELLAFDALGERDYVRAADFFLRAERGDHAAELQPLRVLALGLAGRLGEARRVIAGALQSSPSDPLAWTWLARRFGAEREN